MRISLFFVMTVGLLAGPALAAPASQPASAAVHEPDPSLRPELFRDTPPDRVRADTSDKTVAPESAASFWLTMLLRTALVLAAVVLLAYLTLNKGLGRLLKMTGASTGRNLRVVERLALDAKHALFLVEAEGRRFMLASGEGGTRLIAELESAATTTLKDVAFAPKTSAAKSEG